MSDTSLSIARPNEAVPQLVWVAVAMMLVQLPVSLIYALFLQPVETGFLLLAFLIAAIFVALGLVALLPLGYGWVRHFFVASALLRLPQLALALPQLFASSPVKGVLVLGMNLWFFAALALLYFTPARTWFRDARIRRRSGL